mmetsp:Transcript_35114/g.76740  ORF Transcript_35114/g.76740 Transcript_35114/m.76740 type:complete len:404 (-) Transcript_35114:383-1594(-)
MGWLDFRTHSKRDQAQGDSIRAHNAKLKGKVWEKPKRGPGRPFKKRRGPPPKQRDEKDAIPEPIDAPSNSSVPSPHQGAEGDADGQGVRRRSSKRIGSDLENDAAKARKLVHVEPMAGGPSECEEEEEVELHAPLEKSNTRSRLKRSYSAPLGDTASKVVAHAKETWPGVRTRSSSRAGAAAERALKAQRLAILEDKQRRLRARACKVEEEMGALRDDTGGQGQAAAEEDRTFRQSERPSTLQHRDALSAEEERLRHAREALAADQAEADRKHRQLAELNEEVRTRRAQLEADLREAERARAEAAAAQSQSEAALAAARQLEREVAERERLLQSEAQRLQEACCVCMDAPQEACLTPCGHVALCYTCALTLAKAARRKGPNTPANTCPICRKRIKAATRMYFP